MLLPGQSDVIAALGLTEPQSTALTTVALLGEECAHPRYGRRTPLGTIVLTVNAGYE